MSEGNNENIKETEEKSNNTKIDEKDEKLILDNPDKVTKKERYFGIDVIRVLACYLVMQTHAGEFYYINTKDGSVKEGDQKKFSGIYNSLARPCVPLFIIISGYLLLPVKTDIKTFIKKRFTRVAFPFIFFCIAYDIYNYFRNRITISQMWINIPKIFINYGTEVGHLWYIYMQLGIYLFAPIISPWIKAADFSQYLYYLVIWGVTTISIYVRRVYPEILGEAYWNNTGMLQSFIGNFGYAVLGAFIKIHLKNYDLYILGACLYVIGASVTMGGFFYYMPTAKMCPDIEVTWHFNTINLCLQSVGIVLVLRKLKSNNKVLCQIFNDIALKSYGMYLIHIFFLDLFYYLFDGENRNPAWCIFALAWPTFFTSYAAIKLISYIPYSQYIIG